MLALEAAYERTSIGRGNRILCQLRTCPEHVIATAAAWVGGVHHLLNLPISHVFGSHLALLLLLRAGRLVLAERFSPQRTLSWWTNNRSPCCLPCRHTCSCWATARTRPGMS